MEIYRVGGAVRDRLLGLPVKDNDWVVVGATPEEMQAQGFKPVGRDFPVFLHPETHEEYALARTERKSGRGYRGFTFHAAPDVTLEEDLRRRDLTINAMAEAADGTLIDPWGGQRDLEQRLLRHVSPAFAEDPLRVLRVARFAARFRHLGFRVADETLALMRKLAGSGELADLSAERVWKELERALTEPTPARFFEVLHDSHALAPWFVELEPLLNDPEARAKLTATLNRPGDAAPEARLAAALHPLPLADAEALAARLKAPRPARDLILLVNRLADDYLRIDALGAEQKLALWEQLDLARRPERIGPFTEACRLIDPACTAEPLHQLCARIESVQPRQLVAEGFKGKALGEELRKRRLMALA